MSIRTTAGRGLAAAWRHAPVRGGGQILGPLVLDHQPPLETTAPWAGGKLSVSFENPPEASIWLWNTYEPDVIAALERLVRPGDTAVDIGANCGVLTMKMRELTGPQGAVLAIDPSQQAIDRVTGHAALNGWDNVSTALMGLGATEGTATFHLASIGIGALPAADLAFGRPETVEVAIRRLDDVLADRGLAPALIKIDTDGGELDILEGAAQTLEAHRPALVFELCVDGLLRRGRTPAALEQFLHDAGYELWAPVVSPRPRWLVGPPRVAGFRPVASFEHAGPDVPNLVAVDPVAHRGWATRDPRTSS